MRWRGGCLERSRNSHGVRGVIPEVFSLGESRSSSPDTTIAAVRQWLATTSFQGASDDAFIQKWNALDENTRMVIAGLIDEGGHAVAAAALASSMRRLFGPACVDTANQVLQAELVFQNTGVVRTNQTDYGKEFSLQDHWESSLRRAVAEWLRKR